MLVSHYPRTSAVDQTVGLHYTRFRANVRATNIGNQKLRREPRLRRGLNQDRIREVRLVVGSSLMVYSGYRFVQAARDAGKPIAAVNLGVTRADDVLSLKINQSCAEALSYLLEPQAA